MVDVVSYCGSAINATRVEFNKTVNGIDGALIYLADTTNSTYSNWVGRMKTPGIMVAYPTTGSPDFFGAIYGIEKTTEALLLTCRGLMQNGFEHQIPINMIVGEGLVISTSSVNVTLDTTYTASAYKGYAISFDDLTKPIDISDWITASTASSEYLVWLSQYLREVTASTGTLADTYTVNNTNLEVFLDTGSGYMFGDETHWYLYTTFQFSVASLTYGSGLYQLKCVYHCYSPELFGWNVKPPSFEAWHYTASGGFWEQFGTGSYYYTNTAMTYPTTPDIYESYNAYVSSNHVRIRIGSAMHDDILEHTQLGIKIDYIGIKCVYGTINRVMQIDPCSIVSHTASVFTLAIEPALSPYNVISGDGWTILTPVSDAINYLLPYITNYGVVGLAYASSVNVTGWTGRKERFSKPGQAISDMCKENNAYFWVRVDTNGAQTFRVDTTWDDNSLSITNADIDPTTRPRLKVLDSKYDGILVIGARHRYGDQYVDVQGEYGDASANANVKVYRATHINTKSECDKIAKNLWTKYSTTQEVLSLTLQNTATARRLQVGEKVDITSLIVGKTFSAVPCTNKTVKILPAEDVVVIEATFGVTDV